MFSSTFWSTTNQKALLTAALLATFPLAAQQPDNTAKNKEARDQGAVTAGKQAANKSDTELTKKIRKSVIADKSMSTYAKNIKIVSRDGHVTVKGPVRSEEEKSMVLQKAKEIAGDSNVTDEVTIAPGK